MMLLPLAPRWTPLCAQLRHLCTNTSKGIASHYEIVEPCYPVTLVKRDFPPDIEKPDYAKHGYPNKHTNSNVVKPLGDIYKIWNSCKIAKKILMNTGQQVKVGNA